MSEDGPIRKPWRERDHGRVEAKLREQTSSTRREERRASEQPAAQADQPRINNPR